MRLERLDSGSQPHKQPLVGQQLVGRWRVSFACVAAIGQHRYGSAAAAAAAATSVIARVIGVIG